MVGDEGAVVRGFVNSIVAILLAVFNGTLFMVGALGGNPPWHCLVAACVALFTWQACREA